MAARDAGVTAEFCAKPITGIEVYRKIVEGDRAPRSFVRTNSYFGPDRRRHDAEFSGPEKRRDRMSPGRFGSARSKGKDMTRPRQAGYVRLWTRSGGARLASRVNRRAGARRRGDGFEAERSRAAAFLLAARILILVSSCCWRSTPPCRSRRIDRSGPEQRSARELQSEAQLLVAQAETDAVRLRLSIVAAAQRLQRTPCQPLEAAGDHPAHGRPGARAPLTEATGRAGRAGLPPPAPGTWPGSRAAAAAKASGKSIWLGLAGAWPAPGPPIWPPRSSPPAGGRCM